MKDKVVSFGEVLMRLQPPNNSRFLQAKSYNVVYGGSEANVAVSLAQLGLNSEYVTKLPDNDIGKACRNELRQWGVDTSHIKFGGDRIGIYFCEKGASQRPSTIIYDRANSAIERASQQDFYWEEIFKNAIWFHFSGITPALGDNMIDIMKTACEKAKLYDVKISCDLNYRSKLWKVEKAGKVMSELMPYINLLIANEEHADMLFGVKTDKWDIEKGRPTQDGYGEICSKLSNMFGIEKIAITMRETLSAQVNEFAGLLHTKNGMHKTDWYKIDIVDRIGGGDAFAAGLIYALVKNYKEKDAVEFATAAGCLKHTVEGDYNIASLKEVNSLLYGNKKGRVQR